MLVSVATMGAVVWYFVSEYFAVEHKRQILAELAAVGRDEGPCAGLEMAHNLAGPLDFHLQRAVQARRRGFAAEIVGAGDAQARAALLGAQADGFVDRTLCEQIKLVLDLGEIHPVLELLRFTREGGDPCQDPEGLSQALASLTSHRSRMLRALMEQVAELHCVPPWLATRLAEQVLSELHEEPAALDDLDTRRIAKFLDGWSPVQAAQLSCLLETDGRASKVGSAIGCTPYHKRFVLPRYRCDVGLPATAVVPEVSPGSEVLLLWQEGDRCHIRPDSEPPRAATVSCGDLSLLSNVHVAVLVELVEFGLVRASLMAGVVTYDGANNRVQPTRKEPDLESWYGYDRRGLPVGMTHAVRLKDLGARFGADVPDHPLRTFCRQSGARYCYDVDWAQVVGVLEGDPVVYLSRPMRVFLEDGSLPEDVTAHLFSEAFGRTPSRGSSVRAFELAGGGHLLVEVLRGGLEVRWHLGEDPWRGDRWGAPKGGRVPSAARLLAAMDLEGDGRPELLVQRVHRTRVDGAYKDSIDEIIMLGLNAGGTGWQLLNTLTIHEY
jgi:hypothetical protein